MTEFERKCYGMSVETIRKEYLEGFTARTAGVGMVVLSTLSDAQELLAMDDPDAARREINIAKFIIQEMMKQPA